MNFVEGGVTQDHARSCSEWGGGSLKSIQSTSHQGPRAGALDTPTRALKARWRIYTYMLAALNDPHRALNDSVIV